MKDMLIKIFSNDRELNLTVNCLICTASGIWKLKDENVV